MGYKIIISQQAQQEIEDAIDYYSIRSSDAPKISFQLLTKLTRFYLWIHILEFAIKMSGLSYLMCFRMHSFSSKFD